MKKAHRQRHVRPWGHWEVLTKGRDFQVKELVVKPGQRLSYQKHAHRDEHWFVVVGTALVTLEARFLRLFMGSSVDIPAGIPHRLANPGKRKLVVIEVSRGERISEDDIQRLEDDYGRVRPA